MVGVGGLLDAHVRGAVLLPVRGGNGVPWSSASEAELVAVAFERAVALGAADLREKNKCSIRILTAKSLEINCFWPRDRFPVGVESERMPQGERKSVLSLVLPHMNRGRACVVAAL